MLIFYYVSMAIVALGVVVTAVGIAVALKYAATVRHPPDSEEDEERRNRLGITAVSLVIIGVLLCGVGVLFQ
jgi:heme/copper-type cytochrome/quinol oxidase subunit 2